ncbi:hypothetical protein Selli1_02790 [Sellimonas catena]|uniref:Uncharacterized protein n=1 Tax=Sellimonas catena TaxID=2994035 RepID=A0A9W6FIT1_9FIRM|nr:hypothetical protein Selli1_02790 [Sellimonas catena]GLG91447.1 hypothetical protein Selli2_28740 [Sellimonas catena]
MFIRNTYIKMGDYTGITKAVCVIMNRNDEKQTAKEKIHGNVINRTGTEGKFLSGTWNYHW